MIADIRFSVCSPRVLIFPRRLGLVTRYVHPLRHRCLLADFRMIGTRQYSDPEPLMDGGRHRRDVIHLVETWSVCHRAGLACQCFYEPTLEPRSCHTLNALCTCVACVEMYFHCVVVVLHGTPSHCPVQHDMFTSQAKSHPQMPTACAQPI